MSDNENTYHEYWSNVEAIGVDAIDEAKRYQDHFSAAEEAVDNQIHEACDGSYWVIYTHAATKALVHSDNESAFFDAGMDASGWDCLSDVVTQLAYFALEQDVWDRMEDNWEDDLTAYFDDTVLTCEDDECGKVFTQKQIDEGEIKMTCPECEGSLTTT